MNETGVVKFRCEHLRVVLEKFRGFGELNECRRELVKRGWIGVDENGIGFGNLSLRDGDSSQFFITGSGTAAKRELTPADYAHVIDHDFNRNWLRCEGLVVASSESLTHAAIYESDRRARAVIHIHDARSWKLARAAVPSTAEGIEYGTPAMAREVGRLFAETNVAHRQIFRMGGHCGGLIALGRDTQHALTALRDFNRKLRDVSPTAE